MKKIWKKISSTAIDLAFPPLCLHCHKISSALFCLECAVYFELIDPAERCLYCFDQKGSRKACATCIKKRRWELKIASSLDYFKPVATFVKMLKRGKTPYLAKTAAAFMVIQYIRMQWPEPDLIVPVPSRVWFQGMNHASLLAKAVASFLNKPCRSVVGRNLGDISQTHLSQEQRENLPKKNFFLKKGSVNLVDKKILLIDDVVTTGTTLRNTALAISTGLPHSLYALTFAHSMQTS